MSYKLSILAASLMLNGCVGLLVMGASTIADNTIPIDSQPSGAECYFVTPDEPNLKHHFTTPDKITVGGGEENTVITCSKEGFKDVHYKIKKDDKKILLKF